MCENNDNPDVCPEAPFSGDPRRVETGTLTCLASRWAGLYMLWLFMLESIFERTWVFRDFLVLLSSSMPNLFWTWGWSGYRGVFEYWGVFGMFSLFLY